MTDFRIRIAPTTRLLGAMLLMAAAVAPALAADPKPAAAGSSKACLLYTSRCV